MTIPTAGSLSLARIRSEFGAPAGTPLHAFTRGDGYVPNIPANYGVPTSPPISMDDLRGATAYTPMTVSVANVAGTTLASTTGYITPNANASVSGGNASKTYACTYRSGASFTINSPSAQQTGFTQVGRPPAGTYTGTYRYTVNDGTASVYDDFTVTVHRN